MKEMLRLAVIGAGMHSTSNHGPALYKENHPEEIELAAVCDLDKEKCQAYAEKFGFANTYTTIDEMLAEEELDGLLAITPVHLTYDIVSNLLAYGLPVMIEKPPGQNAQETRRLWQIAQEHHTLHQLSFNRRFNPALLRAREWLDGVRQQRPPQLVLGRMLRHGRNEPRFVVNTGIHLIDTALSFLGIPDHVSSVTIPLLPEGGSLWHARATFGQHAVADFVIAPVVGVVEETYEIQGQDYCVQVDTQRGTVRIYDAEELVISWEIPAEAEPWYAGGAYGETERFVHAIRQKSGAWPDLRDGLASMLTAEAIQKGGETDIQF